MHQFYLLFNGTGSRCITRGRGSWSWVLSALSAPGAPGWLPELVPAGVFDSKRSGIGDLRLEFVCLRCLRFKAASVTGGGFWSFGPDCKVAKTHESPGGDGGVRMLTLSAVPARKPSDTFLPVVTHGKETICQNPSKTHLCDGCQDDLQTSFFYNSTLIIPSLVKLAVIKIIKQCLVN